MVSKDEFDTVDMEAVKRDYELANAKSSRFAPKTPGEYNIRILPPVERGLYFREFGLHYDVSMIAAGAASERYSVACLRKTLNQDCPLCRVVDGLFTEARRAGGDDRVTLNRALRCRAKPRFVMNVVDMDNPKAGVLTWEIGQDAMGMVRQVFNKFGNVTHPTKGRVLCVTYQKKENFTVIQSVLPVGDDPIEVRDWVSKRKDLDEYVQQYIVPAQTLRQWLAAEAPPSADDDESVVEGAAEDLGAKVDDMIEERDDEEESDPLRSPEVQRLIGQLERRKRR